MDRLTLCFNSTHALARDPRFSFMLFGFETLRNSHLDLYCESVLRESLYNTAYSWFAVRSQCVAITFAHTLH